MNLITKKEIYEISEFNGLNLPNSEINKLIPILKKILSDLETLDNLISSDLSPTYKLNVGENSNEKKWYMLSLDFWII